jgi:hypothetical protein
VLRAISGSLEAQPSTHLLRTTGARAGLGWVILRRHAARPWRLRSLSARPDRWLYREAGGAPGLEAAGEVGCPGEAEFFQRRCGKA